MMCLNYKYTLGVKHKKSLTYVYDLINLWISSDFVDAAMNACCQHVRDREVRILHSVGCNPLPKTLLDIQFSADKYNRLKLPAELEAGIDRIWQVRSEHNPSLWNGSKFRLHSYNIDSSGRSENCKFIHFQLNASRLICMWSRPSTSGDIYHVIAYHSGRGQNSVVVALNLDNVQVSILTVLQ